MCCGRQLQPGDCLAKFYTTLFQLREVSQAQIAELAGLKEDLCLQDYLDEPNPGRTAKSLNIARLPE